jgi:hypothetical protein
MTAYAIATVRRGLAILNTAKGAKIQVAKLVIAR